MKVGIVAAPARKTNGKGMADILFAKSPLYRYATQYCRKNYDKVFILTTKYGLISPTDTIEAYDQKLEDLDERGESEWKNKVISQIYQEITRNTELYFHMGRLYRNPIIEVIKGDYKCLEPTKGKFIGQLLKFYRTELGFDKED